MTQATLPVALITGLGGFTGRYLAPLLVAQGYRVVGLEPQTQECGYELRVCDLLDRRSLNAHVTELQPAVVAHLAGISFVDHGDTEAIYRVNVVGSRNLLDALASCASRPKAILLASSANIYGNSLMDPITEDAPPQPANDYAVSKLAMEYVARLWMDRLPITIARPFNYTGVGQSVNFLLPKIVYHYQRGLRRIDLGNLDVARDFSDVRTVAAAYAKLIELSPAGEVFNVCSGKAHTLRQVLDMAANMAGYTMDVSVNPQFVRDNEVKILRGSCEKLHAAIGLTEPHDLSDTIRWMFSAA
jgi:nucleoside-diphosphate-sugar epimerase